MTDMDYEVAHGIAQIELAKAKAEIERLRAALSWIADHDPQIVIAAREKFGINEQ